MLIAQVPFADVIAAVAETAFVTSTLPVILSLEMHCSSQSQAKMAQIREKDKERAEAWQAAQEESEEWSKQGGDRLNELNHLLRDARSRLYRRFR